MTHESRTSQSEEQVRKATKSLHRQFVEFMGDQNTKPVTGPCADILIVNDSETIGISSEYARQCVDIYVSARGTGRNYTEHYQISPEFVTVHHNLEVDSVLGFSFSLQFQGNTTLPFEIPFTDLRALEVLKKITEEISASQDPVSELPIVYGLLKQFDPRELQERAREMALQFAQCWVKDLEGEDKTRWELAIRKATREEEWSPLHLMISHRAHRLSGSSAETTRASRSLKAIAHLMSLDTQIALWK